MSAVPHLSALSAVQLATQRLKAKMNLLDSVGVDYSSNYYYHDQRSVRPGVIDDSKLQRRVEIHGEPQGAQQPRNSQESYGTSSIPLEVRAPLRRLPTEEQPARRSQPVTKETGRKDNGSSAVVAPSRNQHRRRDPPLTVSRTDCAKYSTPAAMVHQPIDHNHLVSCVMKDFGFDYETARRLPRPGSGTPPDAVLPDSTRVVHRPPSANDEATATAAPSMNVSSVVGTAAGVQDDDNGLFNDTGYVVNNAQDASSPLEGDDELPRPQTPPRPSARSCSVPLVQNRHHDPNVLVIAGFEEDEHSATRVAPIKATVEISREGIRSSSKDVSKSDASTLGAKRVHNRSASASRPTSAFHPPHVLGQPTFSASAISDLLSKTGTGLCASKRDELFAVAQRAYEGIVGPKQTTSAVYQSFPNICRSSEKNLPPTSATRSLKSVDDIFQSVVGYTTLQHQMGTLISDQRAVHKKLVVPGGCSASAAEIVSRQMGRMGQLLRVVAAPAPSTALSSGAQSARKGSASRSPPRWPRRVVSTPYVTNNLSRDETQVRHVSAVRRALHPSAVKGTQHAPRGATPNRRARSLVTVR